MQIVQYFPDGTISFNWEQMPANVRSNTQLRDKIFQELQDKFKVDEFLTSKTLFDINRYTLNRIVSELKDDIKKKKEAIRDISDDSIL
jgi:hypothetical protein